MNKDANKRKKTPQFNAEQQRRLIEAAGNQTMMMYRNPTPVQVSGTLQNWFTHQVVDLSLTPRVKDLYDDRTQTIKQQGTFFVARQNLIPAPNDHVTRMRKMYDRVLNLYEERLRLIQNEGTARLNLWLECSREEVKISTRQNRAFIAACTSTLVFMEDDYMKRKMDFVTEVYAVLEKHDLPRAKMVLDDVGVLYPQLKTEFITRLEDYVVAYDELKEKLPQV